MKTCTAVIALLCCATFSHAANPVEEMAVAANAFLKGLDTDLRAQAQFEFKDDERLNWHFVPKARKGLPFKSMSPPQRDLAVALVKSGLSQRGYTKVSNVMSLEQVLFALENQSARRDPENYFVTIFGEPGPKAAWGWRLEGHHLSINFTFAEGREAAVTPTFLGANPAEVRTGPRKGFRALAEEEDLGRQLVKSLSAAQRKEAVIDTTAPRDIITGAARRVQPLPEAGLALGGMTEPQRELLLRLISEYVYRNRAELADADLARIRKAGLEEIRFAWAGGLEPKQGHYYRIQGPTFLMEYDNTQNDANHIHTVWRDFNGDFGEDILRRHYEEK